MKVSKIEENSNVKRQIIGVAEYRASIFPSPDDLERYETLHNGTAEMLFKTDEKQVEHRRKTEAETSKREAEASKRAGIAQILAFTLTLLTIIGGFVLIFLDKDVYGIVAILGAIATLLSSFWGNLLKRNK
jgi:uncharacterized membrane protein